MRPRALSLLAPLLAGALGAAPARAQLLDAHPFGARRPSTFVGGGLQVAQPVGEFDSYVDVGFGIAFHVLQHLDPARVSALRLDAAFVNYGHERVRVSVDYGAIDRVPFYVVTDNNIFTFSLGPQFMVPAGPVRPYVRGSVGGAYFFTQSSIEGTSSQGEPAATSKNFDDWTLALVGGAGVYIPVDRYAHPFRIDIGATYQRNGRTLYLREGSIQDTPSGAQFTPILSDANLVLYHVGVSVGVP